MERYKYLAVMLNRNVGKKREGRIDHMREENVSRNIESDVGWS